MDESYGADHASNFGNESIWNSRLLRLRTPKLLQTKITAPILVNSGELSMINPQIPSPKIRQPIRRGTVAQTAQIRRRPSIINTKHEIKGHRRYQLLLINRNILVEYTRMY